jgi:hypothetical protein
MIDKILSTVILFHILTTAVVMRRGIVGSNVAATRI